MSASKDTRPVRRTMLHVGKKYSYEQLVFAGPGGVELPREVIRHPGAAAILPLLVRGEKLPTGAVASEPMVVFIRGYRIAPAEVLWELPCGTMEHGEDPACTAPRELEEEAGYRAASITPIGRFYTSPGLSDEVMHSYLARGLTFVGQKLEIDEDLSIHPVPVPEALAMAVDGRLMDGKSITTLLMAERLGMLEPA